jgi:hypothetical protein
MARTYLQLVNDVLVRVREPTVSTVTQTAYSTLIGALVNDAKREVEDAWQWSQLLDYLSFSCVNGVTVYETNAMVTRYAAAPISAPNGAEDRTRVWLDPQSTTPILLNTSLNFESLLNYEPTLFDQVTHVKTLNNPTINLSVPSTFQVIQSTANNQAGMWNKQILLYPIPDANYTMRLYIVHPQNDFELDTEVLKVPTAPVVQKAYLYALYERGEELGEALTLTTEKVENTLADAISLDQATQQTNFGLLVPYGGKY